MLNDDPMFATRIYKTDKGWSVENILTDVFPDGTNTFCDDFFMGLAWKNFMYYLSNAPCKYRKPIACISQDDFIYL